MDASTDDLQGYIRWPWGVLNSQIESGDKQPFLKWEETKQGDTTFYAGWMNHYARLDREQKDLEGARDDASLQLTFDIEQHTIKGSLNAHIVTAYKWPCVYLSGAESTYGCPGDFGDNVKEGLCEGWIEGDIDIPLVENYKNSWAFKTDVPMTVKFHTESIVSYWHPPSTNRTVERTETLTLPCNVNGNLNYFDGKISLSIWIQYSAGVEDLEGPSLNVMKDFGGYECTVCRVTEWFEQTDYKVSGPESIEYPTDEEAVFEIERTGSEIDYDEVEWVFSYKDRDDEWRSIHRIGRADIASLKIDGEDFPSFNEWNLLMADNAELEGNYYSLEMSVVVDFYSNGQKVSTTNTHNFQYKSKIELRLSVASQTVISPDMKGVSFFLSGEGVGKDLVRWTDWHFSYKDEQGQWIDLDPLMLEQKLTSITVNETGEDICLDYWFDLAEDQGVDHEGGKLLEMRVFVKAYSNDETLLNTSNTHSFSLETKSESYKITGFSVPLILMNVQLKRDGETFSTSTDESGYLTVPSRFLTHGDYEIELYFALKVGEIIHFNIVGKAGPVKIVVEIQDNEITKMRLVVVPGTVEVDLEIISDSPNDLRLDRYFTGDNEWLATYIKFYIHFTEAKNYYESVLKEEVRLNLPLEISPFVPNVDYPMYVPNVGIAIDKVNSLQTSKMRPIMEYHEFSHYAMHSIYGQFPKPPVGSIEEKNHGGYINPSTADSYIEGFAHFMSMIINEHYGDQWTEKPEISSPDICGTLGSLELNYKAWEKRGKAEELAVAGILWDLYDGEKHEEARIKAVKELAKEQWDQLLYDADLNGDGVIENREITLFVALEPITKYVYEQFFYFSDPDKDGDGSLDKEELTWKYRDEDPEKLTKPVPEIVDDILQYDTEPKDGKLSFKELVEATRKERLKLLDKTPKIDKIPEQRTYEDILKDLEEKFVENDRVSLGMKELWAILRTYKNDFTDVYNALISVYGEQKDAIDEIFKSHGFWIDENVGDRMWDRNSEPIRDTVDDGRLDENDYFIDYPSAGFVYDDNEIIGSSGNYQRKNRTSIVYFPGHFIKVDNSVPSYTVTIGVFTNPDLFGLIPDQIYEISCQNLDGYIFVPVPPESYNSTIAVMPDEVEAEIPMIFTSRDFEEHYDESIEQGYFREHNFAIEGEPSEPEPTPSPEPDPTPQPEPEPEPKPGGIPGFPLEAVLAGLMAGALLLWQLRRRY